MLDVRGHFLVSAHFVPWKGSFGNKAVKTTFCRSMNTLYSLLTLKIS
jgi:hypothetical protein